MAVVPVLLAATVWMSAARGAEAPGDRAVGEQEFEQHIRPLLERRCMSCHGPEKHQGDVRLDLRESVLGAKSGEGLVIPGNPDDSRIVQVIRYSRDDTQMPPTGKLPEQEVELLTNWVREGAVWPELNSTARKTVAGFPRNSDGSIDFRAVQSDHWSFRPIVRPAPPPVLHPERARGMIDRLVMSQLDAAGLDLSPPADRRTLARRAWFDLLGVLPTFDDVEAFAADDAPDAFPRLVDRLLSSPEYGQRWGRHWLDIARYADTKGYVFTENRYYPFSFTYRDYVIDAFNADKPYDQFIVEQLAADRLGRPEGDPSLAALGFLTVGRRYLNSQQDIIDDRIDVVSRGLLGLSVGCARCHDHKFDPIPTADYYSLYGVFASCHEPQDLPLIGAPADVAAGRVYYEELAKREAAVESYLTQTYQALLEQLRTRSGDYLLALLKADKRIPEGVAIPYANGEPRDRLVQQWRRLIDRRSNSDPVFRAWKSLERVSDSEFAERLASLLAQPEADGKPLNRRVREALELSPPKSAVELAQGYGRLFATVDAEWQAQHPGEEPDKPPLPDSDSEQVRRVLYGDDSITAISRDRVERLFERDNRDQLRNLKQQINALNVESAGAPPRAMVLLDNDQPMEPVIFVRGNAGRQGDRVPRRFLQILAPEGAPFHDGSGRLELAKDIVEPENPLTSRVLTNRLWMLHFGTPLVSSPSDFGYRSDPPTHPELLDYLATRLVESGWSIKALQREILLSAAWQQQSLDRPAARAIDPENRWYWRMNRRRREFEAQRDAWLAAAGRLNSAFGGRPIDLEAQPFTSRRTVYGLIDRNNLPGLLRTFDFPTPDVSSAERPRTTVPQQALFSMNSPFIQQMAQSLAEKTSGEADPAARLDRMFEICFARRPTLDERNMLAEALNRSEVSWANVAQVLLMSNELTFVD